MNFQTVLTLALLMTTETISWAGQPIQATRICPVGGEEFKVTETISCSTFGQNRTMSMRPITSCDFVTRLPVCPANGLPIYQDFTPEQITELETFVETTQFQKLKALPPWQRAYEVSKHLGETGTRNAFQVMIGALWYEGKDFFKGEDTVDQFLGELENEMSRASEQDIAFLQAITAYVLVSAGRNKEADFWLEKAGSSAQSSDYLKQYLAAILMCKNDAERKGCGPMDRFNYIKPPRSPVE